jgi:hypothetical protein
MLAYQSARISLSWESFEKLDGIDNRLEVARCRWGVKATGPKLSARYSSAG